jgi:hypothetical protein
MSDTALGGNTELRFGHRSGYTVNMLDGEPVLDSQPLRCSRRVRRLGAGSRRGAACLEDVIVLLQGGEYDDTHVDEGRSAAMIRVASIPSICGIGGP